VKSVRLAAYTHRLLANKLLELGVLAANWNWQLVRTIMRAPRKFLPMAGGKHKL